MIISLSPLSLTTDVTDATLGANVLWLGTRTGAGGTAILTKSFSGRSPWLHGQQVTLNKNCISLTFRCCEIKFQIVYYTSIWGNLYKAIVLLIFLILLELLIFQSSYLQCSQIFSGKIFLLCLRCRKSILYWVGKIICRYYFSYNENWYNFVLFWEFVCFK